MSAPDTRCCGSGVCIINPQGECWCGQVWNGEKMAHPALKIIESDEQKNTTISGDQADAKPEA